MECAGAFIDLSNNALRDFSASFQRLMCYCFPTARRSWSLGEALPMLLGRADEVIK